MSLWERFRAGLARTRGRIESEIGALLSRRGPVDPAERSRLEDALIESDLGPAAAERMLGRAEERLRRDPALDLRTALEQTVAEALERGGGRFEPGTERPWVALLAGVNGAGKTTLAGKLAASLAARGHRPLLVAADTFRAAASEQLSVWAERARVPLVSSRSGADPAAVVHDALTAARARDHDVVLVDTAGRLHTRGNLMAEIQKIHRVCGRAVPSAPHHVLLVLDATLGQNSLRQAREFQRALPVTSLALTKLDGTARGGAAVAIVEELGLPISVVGLGEGLEDWQPFDAQAFARGLFG